MQELLSEYLELDELAKETIRELTEANKIYINRVSDSNHLTHIKDAFESENPCSIGCFTSAIMNDKFLITEIYDHDFKADHLIEFYYLDNITQSLPNKKEVLDFIQSVL